jgi:hypothetical protein
LVGAFSRTAPAVLLVCGDPGSGRSHLLAALKGVAVERGFQCIGVDEHFFVGPATTTNDVLRVLEATIGDQKTPGPDDEGSVPESSTNDARTGPGKPSGWAGAVAAFATGAVGLLRRTVVESRIVSILADAGPLMLAIDGYSPSPAFDQFMVERLVPALRSPDRPVVIVVSGSLESTKRLREVADVVEDLGPLNVDEVRTHFEALSGGVTPSVSADELAAYAAAASESPSLLDAFARVFAVLAVTRR